MPRPPQHRLPRTQYFVPVGFTHFHPCHLNAADRARIRRRFNPRGIFLNIPYAAAYTQLELATISTATAYELTPMMARQRDTFEIRFRRIWEMILSCAFGFTDLSYTTRLNMPLELGLMLASGKTCFIASRRRYGALARISDLNLGDIHYHEGRPRRLIAGLSHWIEQHCSHRRIEVERLVNRFKAVVWLREWHLGPEEFDRLPPEAISAVLRTAQTNLGVFFGPLP